MDSPFGEDGSVWIGIDMPGRGLGLERFDHGKLNPFKTERWNSSGTAVNRLLRDSHGALWVATDDKGVYRILGGIVDHFGSVDGLTGDRVMALFEDREGDIWVATTKGIDCLRDLAVATFSAQEGLGTEVDTVLASRDGTVWAGGTESLDALKDGNITSFRTGKNLPGQQITSLLEDHEGGLWVGIDHTMSILKGGSFVPIKRPDGGPLGFAVGMSEDAEGNIWVETTANPRQLIRLKDLQVKEILPSPLGGGVAPDTGKRRLRFRTIPSASGRTQLSADPAPHTAPRRALCPQDVASGWLLFLQG